MTTAAVRAERPLGAHKDTELSKIRGAKLPSTSRQRERAGAFSLRFPNSHCDHSTSVHSSFAGPGHRGRFRRRGSDRSSTAQAHKRMHSWDSQQD